MWDPKKALRIDRAQKQHRETRKIDYSEMNEFDRNRFDQDDEPQPKNRRHNKKD